MTNTSTPPALKQFTVWADRRCYQTIEAASPEEAYRIAEQNPWDFEPCSHGRENYELLPEVGDEETGEEFRVGPVDIQQRLITALEALLDLADRDEVFDHDASGCEACVLCDARAALTQAKGN